MGTESVAQISNNLLYCAMAVYAVAMYCYAAELAFGSRARKSEPALVSANGQGGTSYDDSGVPVEQRADRSGRAERLGRIAVSLTTLAFGLHLASVGALEEQA